MNYLHHLTSITNILFGHASFQYLYAGCELGLFELLNKNPYLKREEISKRLNLEPHPTRCILFGLTSLNLIVKENNEYCNSNSIQSLFVSGSWKDFYNVVVFQAKIVYVGLLKFLESLQNNNNDGINEFSGSNPNFYARLDNEPDLKNVFYNFMSSWSNLSNQLLIDNIDFSKFNHLLDISGGDATNAIAIANKFKNVRITILELPSICEIAREKIHKSELNDRIHVSESDIFSDEFPLNQDCILFIHTLVIWSIEENIYLLRKAYDSLSEGGIVVIFNSIASDSEDGPLMSALDTAYFVAIPHKGGMIYPWSDYEYCLNEAGFRNTQRIHCNSWTPHGIIVATK